MPWLLFVNCSLLDIRVDEEDRQLLATQLLLQSPFGIVYSKHRRSPKRGAPGLMDFRNDTFLAYQLSIYLQPQQALSPLAELR